MMRGNARKITVGIVACCAALGGVVVGIESFAGANQARWNSCSSLSGTAKANVSLVQNNVKPASINFTLTAEDCYPAVSGANGVATRAKITGALKSKYAMCQLSNSSEHPWGQLTIKWQNEAG